MFKAKTHDDFATDELQIIFMEDFGAYKLVATPILEDDKMSWRFDQVENHAVFPKDCIVRFPRDLAHALWEALSEWADTEGLRVEAHERVLGKMDAMKSHLEDMRALVGKAHKVELQAPKD